MVHLSQNTGSNSIGDSSVSADVIGEHHPVRVVGRAKDGVLVKGGEASLLVFAVARGGDVGKTLRRMRRRERVSLALALMGFACVPAAIAWTVFFA